MPHINADYDAANLYVDPDGLKVKADALEGLAENVVDSLSNIEHALAALQLGWAGKTADEAKDFGNRWETVMKELFGSKDHPDTGVLNAIVDGLLITRDDFAEVEITLAEFFQKFAEGLGKPDTTPLPSLGTGGDNASPMSITDTNNTAITETW